MTDRPDQNPEDNTPKKFSRRRSGRRIDPKKLEELEAKRAEQQAREDADAKINARNENNQNSKPTLDKDTLVSEYRSAHDTLTTLKETEATLKTDLSRVTAQHANIAAEVESLQKGFTYELENLKAEQTAAFIKGLETVQKKLEETSSEISTTANQCPEAASVAQGLDMVGKGLSKVFNNFAAPDQKPVRPAQAPQVEAQSFEADTPSPRNLDDLDAVAVNMELDHIKRQIEKTKSGNADLTEKLETARQNLTRVQDSLENDKARAQRDFDQKRPFVLKKLAGEAVAVADNLNMAANALNAQRDQLGTQFNAISSAIAAVSAHMQSTLKQFGIEKMDVKPGDKFDYNQHNAVNTGPATSDIPSEHILDVMSEGYRLNGQSLRDPMVRVAS
tara:strand:+ start:1971 stop:3140 length:1170 start_codon:yes stop_codon:yes gene_type:complete